MMHLPSGKWAHAGGDTKNGKQRNQQQQKTCEADR